LCVLGLLEVGRRHDVPVAIDEFALITFTNKAANELRGRLQAALAQVTKHAGPDAPFWEDQEERLGAAFVGTIHGYCRAMARQFAYANPMARGARTGATSDLRDRAFQQAVAEHVEASPAHCLLPLEAGWRPHEFRRLAFDAFEMIRQSGGDLTEVMHETATRGPADPGKAWRVAFARFLVRFDALYQELCEAEQRVDPDGLLAAFRSAVEDAAFCASVSRRHPYLFVDEFQDTDRVQDSILRALAPSLARLVVVGDAKQSIYGFRGAQHTLLKGLAEDFTGRPPLPLTGARRPTRRLLDAQNALFNALRPRFPDIDEPLQDLGGALIAGDQIVAMRYVAVSDNAQAAREVSSIIGRPLHLRRADGAEAAVVPGDIAVLTRTNAQADAMAEALRNAGLSAQADRGDNIFRRDASVAVRRILLLLRAWDDGALLEAMSTPLFPDVPLARAESQALTSPHLDEASPRRTMIGWLLERERRGGGTGPVTKLEAMRREVPRVTVAALLGALYHTLDLPRRVRDAYGAAGLASLDHLRDFARTLGRDAEVLTLDRFLENLDREILSDRRTEPPATETVLPPFIRCMTVHRAKGLEFPVVVLPFLSARTPAPRRDLLLRADGRLEVEVRADDRLHSTLSPDFATAYQDAERTGIEQHMRLLYVAVTRAQNHILFLGSDEVRPRRAPKTWQEAVLFARGALEGIGTGFVEFA
jgi:ATP-dependent exoDNAse (exonuclease V) beta subunit